MNKSLWRDKRVLVSGHTGFTGGWLSLWLDELGARVCGYALAPPTTVNLYELARVAEVVDATTGDIRDLQRLMDAFEEFQPEIVFHLAAQPLVLKSYQDPVSTYTSNVIGTLHMLEAARRSGSVKSFVNVTTDKCYLNRETGRAYREDDPLGGGDPYSSSKACVEIMSASYRDSFFNRDAGGDAVAMATVRAGNIIGGGDWAEDRLIPDAIRSIQRGTPVEIRNPQAVRPWQHVLDALSGYLAVAEKLYEEGHAYAEAWNIGPDPGQRITVDQVLQGLSSRLEKRLRVDVVQSQGGKESVQLELDNSKAVARLGWRQLCDFEKSMDLTVDWYQAWLGGQDMNRMCRKQIASYFLG